VQLHGSGAGAGVVHRDAGGLPAVSAAARALRLSFGGAAGYGREHQAFSFDESGIDEEICHDPAHD
jgi:hypothetical protein